MTQGMAREGMDLSVCKAVSGLNLQVRCHIHKMGSYFVRGSPSGLRELVQDTIESLEGRVSPLHAVTLPDQMREGAGIPRDATHFAYAYPIEQFEQR